MRPYIILSFTILIAAVLVYFYESRFDDQSKELAELKSELAFVQSRAKIRNEKPIELASKNIAVQQVQTQQVVDLVKDSIPDEDVPFYVEEDEDTLRYRAGAKIPLMGEHLVTSLTGIMLSNKAQTIIYGDLWVSKVGSNDGIFGAVIYIDENGKWIIHHENSPKINENSPFVKDKNTHQKSEQTD